MVPGRVEILMDHDAEVANLKRRLDVLLMRNLSTMGYEAKVSHTSRITSAQRAYEQSLAGAEATRLAPVESTAGFP
ncbi:MAG: hypothetical protein IID43_05365 [Planctomycetes bacterium]|nr:hypothetical protein [Planctomycetota bacterium]